MYSSTTKEIVVKAEPFYLEDESEPAEFKFVWAYTIQVENHSNETVQLINRHWKIIDATGKLEEVKGKGVVGEQPVLRFGQAFQYTSGCVLKTSSGIMEGTYEMETEKGERFLINIPAFSLDLPGAETQLN